MHDISEIPEAVPSSTLDLLKIPVQERALLLLERKVGVRSGPLISEEFGGLL